MSIFFNRITQILTKRLIANFYDINIIKWCDVIILKAVAQILIKFHKTFNCKIL